MKTKTQILNAEPKAPQLDANSGSNIVDYYTDAGPDYEFWSKNFNMHFGYSAGGWDCLSRETMLERMNQVVIESLSLKNGDKVVDLGCGIGATVRWGAKNFPNNRFTGFTITPWQIKKANEFIENQDLQNASVKYGDYNEVPLRKESVDAVFGLESLCHAEGTNKLSPIREAYRILKEEGRFTMVDGFIKKPENEMNRLTQKMHRIVCDNWALSTFGNIHEVKQAFIDVGFKDVRVTDLSWKIAPSAVHSPFVTISFLVMKLLKGEKLQKQNWNNLKACFMIFFLGLCRSSIGYYKIDAVK